VPVAPPASQAAPVATTPARPPSPTPTPVARPAAITVPTPAPTPLPSPAPAQTAMNDSHADEPIPRADAGGDASSTLDPSPDARPGAAPLDPASPTPRPQAAGDRVSSAGDSATSTRAEASVPDEHAATRPPPEPGSVPASAPLFGRPLPAPPSGKWQFRVFYGDYTENRPVAVMDYAIEHADGRYRVHSEGRAEGLLSLFYSGVLTQASAGRLTSDGLQPDRYSERRGNRAERWVSVDRDRHLVVYSGGERATFVDGLQDRLSVVVQLGLIARAMPERLAAGASVEFSETSLRDVERSRYASHGVDQLPTEAGVLRALHLERVAPRKPGDPVIEVWLGYDRGLIPVRIRISEGGRVLDQVLSR